MGTREFTSFLAFAEHLVAARLAVLKAEHHALDKAAQVIEKDAKGRIGDYQEPVGPFNAWPQLADSTVRDRVSKGFTPDDPLLRTGEYRDSIRREVHGREAAIGSDKAVAVYQEVGTDRIPPRPVLGPAAFANKEKVGRIIGEAAVHAIEYGAASTFIPLPK